MQFHLPFAPFLAVLAAGAVLTGAAGTAAWAQPPSPVPAASGLGPAPGQLQSAAARLAALQDAAAREAEAFDAAREALAAARARSGLATATAAAAVGRVATARTQLDDFAAAAYTAGPMASPVTLITSGSPETFLRRLGTIQEVGTEQARALSQLRTAERAAASARTAAGTALTAAAAAAARLQAATTAVRREVALATRALDGLRRQAATADRLLAEAGSDAAARAELPQILAALAQARTALARAHAPQPDRRAADVLARALGQLGKPYQWGAAGPKAFDCSGLTMWLWASVGRSLPHNAAAQYAALPHVSLSQVAPGDLLFFTDPNGHGGTYVGHVGIYIGGGHMIDAPHTGDFVRVDGIWSNVVGAARVP